MTEKNNGTAIGNEKWQFQWSAEGRLTQVTKGVWAAGPVLNNVLTVSYQYDHMGRLLRRVNGATVTAFEFDGWIPIGETTGGVTNPVSRIDPSGLFDWESFGSGIVSQLPGIVTGIEVSS